MSNQQQQNGKDDGHKKKIKIEPEAEHVFKKGSVQVLVSESGKQAKNHHNQQQQQRISMSPAPLDALAAFNTVAALAAAQQHHHHTEQFPAIMGTTPSTSKHLIQLMSSSVSPTATSSAYQRSYLEAFKFYKAAYGSAAASTSGSINPLNWRGHK